MFEVRQKKRFAKIKVGVCRNYSGNIYGHQSKSFELVPCILANALHQSLWWEPSGSCRVCIVFTSCFRTEQRFFHKTFLSARWGPNTPSLEAHKTLTPHISGKRRSKRCRFTAQVVGGTCNWKDDYLMKEYCLSICHERSYYIIRVETVETWMLS